MSKQRTKGERRLRAGTLLDDVLSSVYDIRNAMEAQQAPSEGELLEIEAARDRLSSIAASMDERV